MNPPLTLVSLPLFPLRTVLFPDGRLTLRVFEQRYRTMVRCCLEQDAPFGVVTLTHSQNEAAEQPAQGRFHPLGTLAKITELSAISPQLALLQGQGCERFRITSTRQLQSSIWVADVQLLPPDMSMAIPPDLAHSATALRQVLNKLPQQPIMLPASDVRWNECGWVANRWCELLPLDTDLQLQLLETASPLLRLELVTDALERAGIV
ncbi:LON peptidase substrate-binding domain-containing protein [Comamonas kerstersii]|jgi:Lon protease-like protein|uniref:Lon N-terminal domain-containing protein n=1 Tax=Comamonas kerstersii TaxID=225992 RepID=A0A0W7YX85_9BURK|nr:LON peptidase substrate-binding domain-containing protein [Comamonas kerstersii]AQZ97223.1 hypothetical protein B5M06_02050 [Comamonas kerstersii]KUF39814.1 hypothetical protein AS359_13275 [Comamonas kerstersii]OOH88284.1 hypothetical protein BMF38_02350 [Comamonas kerstersii]OOH91651.1 hypothetical protein BMF29_10315 [Comamonas kerstersii]